MRLFIALDLEEFSDYFGQSISSFKEIEGLNARYVDFFHVTLKFLGECDKKALGHLRERLSGIAFPEFRATLSGLGFFPNAKNIRVLWQAVISPQLPVLQKMLEKRLEGLFQSGKRFHPHVTLARVRNIADKALFLNSYHSITPEPKIIPVRSFRLFKSTLRPCGPLYEALATFAFSPK